MRPDTKKYNVLKAIARADGPATTDEIHPMVDEEYRPEEPSQLTAACARLYADHFVDRRKRDVKYKPMEYWLAAKGRQVLQEHGDLPEQNENAVPVPENTETSPTDTPDTVTCEDCGRVLDVPEGTNPGQVLGGHVTHCEGEDVWTDREAEGDVPTSDVDAIREDLGLDDPEVDTGEALASALAGIVDTLRGLENAVDTLRASAITEAEVEERLDDTTDEDILDRVETLTAQVKALSEQSSARDGLNSEFAPYIARLKALERQGYGVYSAEMSTGYAGKVQEVQVKAKPKSKTDKKGPNLGVEGDSNGVTPGVDGDRTVVQKADSVAESQDDIDPEYTSDA